MRAAAAQLARAVRVHWLGEEEKRRVRDPLPLAVRFTAASRELADYWSNVLGVPDDSAAGPVALCGLIEDFAEVYRGVPSGRMVVLGRGGAGKTVLVLRFVLDLLKRWTNGSPVPVILDIGSWNPATTSLRDWIEARLVRDYAGMGKRERGKESIASVLVADGHVLPIFRRVRRGRRAAPRAGPQAAQRVQPPHGAHQPDGGIRCGRP
ncbi:hypothetical protein SAMN05216188_105237 [Lentzea xinjiangensis]|uniref:Uncharacterized protein n=1 Tax=Lentzea xinjiangensis TaxID=402600 RepID=A0A1H9J6P4_9PSEU|nr:hypothetical protein [Lentzea xinjiangensis]SEQ82554.1 hypothetical protein SAMN05216188_105237 [Lentzea xinjiangensis]